MTKEQFIKSCKDFGISHYNRCVEQWENGEKTIRYIASTPQGYNYGGFQRNTVRCYEWTEESGWNTLFYNLSCHRAKTFLKAYINKELEKELEDVNPVVIENYITNGYSTRRGLFAKYSNEQIKRMGGIARSHANYLGNETGNSTADHYNRVAMRK